MDALVAPLLNSPQLFMHLAELEKLVQAEKQRRSRFYEEITPEYKWEFINGEVIMHSPATLKHGLILVRLVRLLGTYVAEHQLGILGCDHILVTFSRNDYEPDVVFFSAEKAQNFTSGRMQFPPPDFVVEILSESTQARDRGVKLQDYGAHGVQEYWIIDPWEDAIEQYVLRDSALVLKTKLSDGAVRSPVITGLALSVAALFDDAECQRALRAMLA